LESDQEYDLGILSGSGGHLELGSDQCKNDRDGTVDADERLRITDVPPGIYDAKFIDVTGRSCIVRNIKVETGAIFWIEERDLKSCDHR
jgi:hypothetical protein